MNEQASGDDREERAYYSWQRRAWAIFAPVYDAVVFLPLRKLRSEVAQIVELEPGSRLLDVATGTGAQAFAFADKVREVVGIDMSEAMLRIARRKNRFANITFQRADAAELPFEDSSFDASIVSFALHEMPASIRDRVVREMARVTRPAGPIIIIDYGLPRGRVAGKLAFYIIKLYEGDHFARFVKSDWRALLESAGVEVSDERAALHGLARILSGRRTECGRATRLSR